jgi:MoaA/NifB/PqqE/SkfB family radical SAM enzyme
MQLAHFKSSLEQLKGYKIDNLIFTGGEPLLNKNIFEFASMVRAELSPKKLSLMTNGILIQNNIEMICKSFDRVVLSIDSVDNKTYEYIRGVDELSKVLNSIGLLKCNSTIEVKVKCTLQKMNYNQFSEIVETTRKYGADSISFITIDTKNDIAFNRNGIDYQDISKCSQNRSELLDFKKSLSQYIKNNGELFDRNFILESPETLMNILVERPLDLLDGKTLMTSCNALESTVIIESNGDIRNCFFTNKIGNLFSSSLSKALSGEDYQKHLNMFRNQTLKDCEKCICPYVVSPLDADSANMPQR